MTLDLLGGDRFDVGPHLVAILIAYVLALPIGWNREKAERTAGLRTFPLVAMASCGLIQGTENVFAESPEALSKVIEGLIAGIGFIGGGAILRMKHSVRGTATAASLWVTGAMGVAVGLGSLDVALILSLLTFATLQILSPLKPEAEDRDRESEPAESER